MSVQDSTLLQRGQPVTPESSLDPEKQLHTFAPDQSNECEEPEIAAWRRNIKMFTPSWFTINTGTGVVSVLLYLLPYNGRWLYWISIVFFALNVALFLLFLTLIVTRFILFPEVWSILLHDPMQSLFLGVIPLALSTITIMVIFVCIPAWGPWCVTFAWTLWWIDCVLSILSCFYLPWVIINKHHAKIENLTALWLFPVVATGLVSAVGAAMAVAQENLGHALITITVSYVLYGTFLPFAFFILVLYFYRLTIFQLPPRHLIVSVFVPLGPAGMGGFAIMRLGRASLEIIPKTKTLNPLAGQVLYINGFILGLVLWGFGLVWLFFAVASIAQSRFPFNMGWWGFTFPLATMALAAITIGKEMTSRFFDIVGTIMALMVLLLWIMCAVRTVWAIAKRELFFAPCLHDLRTKKEKAEHKGQNQV